LNKIVSKADRPTLLVARDFVSLYALIRMHGTTIALEDSTSAQLLAGYASRHDILEVKVQIEFNDAQKTDFVTGLHVCDGTQAGRPL
jgi:hypothetical protein